MRVQASRWRFARRALRDQAIISIRRIRFRARRSSALTSARRAIRCAE
jgi:hypothetical protein